MFLRPVYNTVRYHRDTARCPIYFYRVSIDSQLNAEKRFMGITKPGVCHADELGYLFMSESTAKIAPGSIEDNGIKVFTTLWTSFAKTDNPNPTEKHPLIDVLWKPVKEGPIDFLDIGENLTVGVNPEKIRMAFWDGIDRMCSVR
uniref:Carboxylesterase type B domain-containing protein n=5 Tax=Photinus pyralis TaxID=7054 RepID=A0A1Y1LJP8_PHOPY